jgi:hypothetical protein
MDRIAMTVQRDGYWDGQYPRAGDIILVEPEHVPTLELAKFAVVVPSASDAPRTLKEKKHGR